MAFAFVGSNHRQQDSAPEIARRVPNRPRCVPGRNTRAISILLIFAHGLFAPACNADECKVPDARCEGNVAEYCDYAYSDTTAPQIWRSTDCGTHFCKVSIARSRPEAFCAFSEKPDPRCDPSQDSESCDGNVIVGCRLGYVEYEVSCDTGNVAGDFSPTVCQARIGTCVSDGFGAICDPNAIGNPPCVPRDSGTGCDGTTRFLCK